MTTIKIYYSVPSYSCHRVLAVLFEKEVTDFEIVKLDLWAFEQNKPEYLAVQPFGKVPALVDGDLTIFESRAICRYLSNKYEKQGTPLFGSSLRDNALVDQWLEVEGQNLSTPIMTVLFENIGKARGGGGPADPAVVDAAVAKISKVIDIYESHLATSKYLAGDFFSLADLVHLPGMNFVLNRFHKTEILENRPHVKQWWEDISSRPSWKKVLASLTKV